MQAHSRETVVLADSSKFGVVSLCRSFGLGVCTVVSDRADPVLDAAAAFVVAPRVR